MRSAGRSGTRDGNMMEIVQESGIFYDDYCRLFVGQQHNVALTDHGELLVWGSNSHGQLGIPGVTRVNLPQTVAAMRRSHVLEVPTSPSPTRCCNRIVNQFHYFCRSHAVARTRLCSRRHEKCFPGEAASSVSSVTATGKTRLSRGGCTRCTGLTSSSFRLPRAHE